jgi:hypothetical protein
MQQMIAIDVMALLGKSRTHLTLDYDDGTELSYPHISLFLRTEVLIA